MVDTLTRPVGAAYLFGSDAGNDTTSYAGVTLAMADVLHVPYGGDGYAVYLYTKRAVAVDVSAQYEALPLDTLTAGVALYSGTTTNTTWTVIPFTPPATRGFKFTVTNNATSFATTFRACSGNVATITTALAHGMVAGDLVEVALMTDATYDGKALVVLSVPTTTSFTYALTHADEGATADVAGEVDPHYEMKALLRWGG